MMTLEEMLKTRMITELEWCDPWPGIGSEGNDLEAYVTHYATVHDCINMERKRYQMHKQPIKGNDIELLHDFIVTNTATVRPKNVYFYSAKDS